MKALRILGMILGLLILLGLVDFYGPWHGDLRKFDPGLVASLETKMWRDYYDKEPAKMYWNLVRLLRTQEGFPPLRAMISAYWAGKAAFIFKQGRKRATYVQALPYLENYYRAICWTGNLKSDPRRLAELELEWWIIHRERGYHGEAALVRAVAEAAGELYQIDPAKLTDYAYPRSKAMLERSAREQNRGMTNADWKEIEDLLAKGYGALSVKLNQ